MQCSFNRLWALRLTDLTHKPRVPTTHRFYQKNHLTQSIHGALSDHTDLGISHSHTPLDHSLLSHWKRVINHNQSFNFCELTNRRKQFFLHRDLIHMLIRESNMTSQNRRSRNCIQVSVAQPLLPNWRKFDCLYTEWRIFTHRITYTSRPRNSWTSWSSITAITYSQDTRITRYCWIQP